ncbi:MAG: hypothetical protein V4539_08960 [Bacteroidota bacterium]
MKRISFLLLVAAVACNQPAENNDGSKDSTAVVSYDTIPEIRTTVKTAPAAEYSEPIKDELNDWKFAVELYETKRTFHYTVRIQAKEARVSDSVNIPNFGIAPKVEIHKGKEPQTCIIGFLDKKGQFMEYRQVSFKNDRLRINTLRTYSVAAYKTKVSQ